MKVKLSQSRVAHRLLTLVLLATFVPLLIVSFLGYHYLKNYQQQQNKQQLLQNKQHIQALLNERVSYLSSQLYRFNQRVTLEKKGLNVTERRYWQRWFSNIVLVRNSVAPIIGQVQTVPALSRNSYRHLKKYGSLVLVLHAPQRASGIYLYQLLSPQNPGRGYTRAHIDNNFLLGRTHLPEKISSICLFAQKRYPFFCSRQPQAKGQRKTTQRYAWATRLDNRLDQSKLTVMLIRPKMPLFIGFTPLMYTLLGLAIISLITILVLALIQIKHVLFPLQQLRKSTRYIAQKNFNAKVNIKSGDEFEELGDSFNAMISKMGKQFNTLETMAQIDRLILSTLDMDKIISTVLTRMTHVAPCDSTSIILFDDKDPMQGKLFYRKNQLSGDIENTAVTFTSKDMQRLREYPTQLKIDNQSITPHYLKTLYDQHRNFLLLPIFLENRLSSIIVLGFYDSPQCSEEDLNQARDVAHRVAVALANAAWEDKLYHQAHHDSLTNLPNRTLFQDRLEQAIARAEREGSSVALLFLDLDRFKIINDSLGHEAGDKLLKEAAHRISSSVRNIDTVSRLGGDEFTVIIPDLHLSRDIQKDISNLASKLLAVTASPYFINEQEVNISVSIGGALYPQDSQNIIDLLRQADSAMYYAKSQGKSNFQFYAKSLSKKLTNRIAIESRLHHALENEEFELFYQPRVNLLSGTIVGAEALIRWHYSKDKIIMPADFIYITEETGLINTIGAWALEQACIKLKEWEQTNLGDLKLSVNLSPKQFHASNLVNLVKKTIAEAKINPARLELEITESTLMHDIHHAVTILEKLNKMGLKLSIDDFGTGYSSLNYLKNFPIHTLKIERSFIHNLSHNSNNAAIVSAIITLAHNLNLTVVAEGVETPEEILFLRNELCEEAQGYIYSQPLTADEFIKFVRNYTPRQKQVS